MNLTPENELLDCDAACRFLGGSRPINHATLYRGIKKSIYPRPIKVGSSSRWLRSELQATLAAMIAKRDGVEAA